MPFPRVKDEGNAEKRPEKGCDEAETKLGWENKEAPGCRGEVHGVKCPESQWNPPGRPPGPPQREVWGDRPG